MASLLQHKRTPMLVLGAIVLIGSGFADFQQPVGVFAAVALDVRTRIQEGVDEQIRAVE